MLKIFCFILAVHIHAKVTTSFCSILESRLIVSLNAMYTPMTEYSVSLKIMKIYSLVIEKDYLLKLMKMVKSGISSESNNCHMTNLDDLYHLKTICTLISY